MADRQFPDSILEQIETDGERMPRIVLRDAYGDTLDPQSLTRVFGRYQIIGEIAAGGVGTVMRARDADLGREVALKMLHAKHLDNPELIQRLIEEAQIGGQLQHPAIVPVYEIGLDERQVPFIAMKLVKGQTLAALLQERDGPQAQRREFLAYFLKACQAMAYAHSRGVVHRDLKPSNLMIGSYGEVMILDWGFAKVLGRGGIYDEKRASMYRDDVTRIETVRSQDDAHASIEGSLMGTPAYMPPEQALGQIDDLDARSDVFSLGAILCEILTGEPPYGTDPELVLTRAARGDVAQASRNLDICDTGQELIDVCKSCLAPLRKDRPKNAQALADALRVYLDEIEKRARRMELVAIKQRELAARAKADATAERAAAQAARTAAEEERAAAQQARAEARREQTAVAQARRARRQVLAIASALLTVVVLGGGGYLLHTRSAAERQREVRAAVEDAVLNAQGHWAAGSIDEAAVAARQAIELGRKGDTDAALIASAEEVLRSAEDEKRERVETAGRERRNARLVADLEECMARRSDIFDASVTESLYIEALRRAGINLAGGTMNIVAAIRALPDPSVVVGALDDLAWLRCVQLKAPAGNWSTVLEVAAAADDDPWRSELRHAARARNAGAVAAAAETDPATLPAHSAHLVGLALDIVGRPGQAAAYLSRAEITHAGDPWMLGLLLHLMVRSDAVAGSSVARYATTLVSLRPRVAELRVELALLEGSAGLLDPALRDCREALALKPDLAEAYAVHAALLDWRGESALAAAEWQKATELNGESAWIRRGYGMALLNQGNVTSALAECRKAAQLSAEDADCQLALAMAAFSAKDLAGARSAAIAAVQAGEDNAQVQRVLGLVFHAADRPRETKAHLDEALRLAPNDPFVHNTNGLFLFARGDFSGAKDAFGRAAAASGAPRAAAWANLAELWLKRDDLEASVQSCREAIQASADTPVGPWRAGFTLSGQTPLEQSTRVLREVVQRNRAYAYAHHWLGIALRMTGKHREAIESCKAALAADPDYGFCMQTLAWIYATCPMPLYRSPEKALELAEQLSRLPNHPKDEAQQILGVALYRMRRHAEAAAALESVNAMQNGGGAWNWYVLAMARWELGNEKVARRWLAKADAWRQENAPKDPLLQQFHDEAHALVPAE